MGDTIARLKGRNPGTTAILAAAERLELNCKAHLINASAANNP
jgi:hypothetical protein